MKNFVFCLIMVFGICLLSVPAHATLLGLTPISNPQCVGPGCTTPSTVGNSTAADTGSCVGGVGVCTDTFLHTSFGTNGCVNDTQGPNYAVNGSGKLVADTCDIVHQLYSGATPVANAVFREVVYQEVSGTLDFYYQVSVTSNATGYGMLDLFTVPWNQAGATYVGTASNVSLLGNTGTTTSPPGVSDSPIKIVDGNGSGSATSPNCHVSANDCVTFVFTPPGLDQGETTMTLVVSTNATSFGADLVGMEKTGQGGGLDPIVGFVGFAPTPEPVSIVLTGTVLALAAFFILRRRAAKNDLSVS